jgi:nucleotide-binding universal stress UspA family protein
MFKTIVWATDGSDAADKALPYAKSLAADPGRTLVVVHAKELLIGRAGGYPVLANEDELEAKIRGQVEEAREDGIDATFKLVAGGAQQAAHMIADAAAELKADVIIVGSRGHGPIAGLLLGSVTQRLLHIAPCPVLAVPDSTQLASAELEPDAVTAALFVLQLALGSSDDELLDVKAAAELLTVRPSTLAYRMREGHVPCIRLGPRATRWTRPPLREIRDMALDRGRLSEGHAEGSGREWAWLGA